MDFNDIWEIRFSATWEPHRVKLIPIDSGIRWTTQPVRFVKDSDNDDENYEFIAPEGVEMPIHKNMWEDTIWQAMENNPSIPWIGLRYGKHNLYVWPRPQVKNEGQPIGRYKSELWYEDSVSDLQELNQQEIDEIYRIAMGHEDLPYSDQRKRQVSIDVMNHGKWNRLGHDDACQCQEGSSEACSAKGYQTYLGSLNKKQAATWEPNKVRNNPNLVFDAFDILSSPFPHNDLLNWARQIQQNQRAPEDQPPPMQMHKTDYYEHLQFVVPKGYDFLRPIWNRKSQKWIEPVHAFDLTNDEAMDEKMKQDGVKWLGMRNNSTRLFHVYSAGVLDKNDWEDIYRYSYSPSSPTAAAPFDGPPSPLRISLNGLVNMPHSDSSLKHADQCSCPDNTNVCAEKAYDWYKELANGTE